MTVKINYDLQTTLVKGYYHSKINYSSIPEPFIEVSDLEHKKSLGKVMCVVNGIFKEYVKPLDVQLQEAKTAKLAQITPTRDAFMYADIEYNGSTFINSQVSGNNLTAEIATGTTLIEWLDVYGEPVDLSLEEAKELSALIKAKRRTGYFQEAALITQINACTTIAEVEAININF